ncbi:MULTISPECIES: hypothetical protein [Asanoa]|uniref:Uncharacterized protein n=2 Tax=Asanoa TaxID=195964 RepID=A0A239PH39_9ACTN|nr:MULTISPECIES: hypothetical protein [Asanoa]GIF74234.1 hypothetical protein Asi02nite_37520 [Asanoa siamensis]SNT66270.1 hypothetical protein SAMN05421812_13617 [Asanoa hainanensis]
MPTHSHLGAWNQQADESYAAYRSDPGPDPLGTLDAAAARGAAANRLRAMNVRQGHYAWQQRRAQPVCPHAVAILFVDPAPLRPLPGSSFAVVAATLMVDDEPDLSDPKQLLFRVESNARDYIAAGSFDPATQLANRYDESSGQAFYLGIALSTLDHRRQPWDPETVGAQKDVPGTCYAWLRDNTVMQIDRLGADGFNEMTVYSNAVVGAGLASVFTADWERVQRPAGVHWHDMSAFWNRLHALHTLLLNEEPRL